MRRALLVSFYFPPRYSIGGKRAHRLARYLPEHGWQTTVLTARAPAGERLDPSFRDEDLPACEVHRDYYSRRELERMPRALLGSDGTIETPTRAWAPVGNKGIFGRVFSELRLRPIVGPDMRKLPLLAARIGRLARRSRSEVLFATGAPWEAVVATTLAGRAIGLPVVVDFRDPWSFGPVMNRSPAWARAVDGRIEALVLQSAAALTVTSETTRDEYARRCPGRRILCIRNGYDPSISVTPRRDARITLVHFGNCYGERNLAPFLRALATIAARRRLGAESVRLLNLGRVAEEDLALARELGIGALFEHRGVLPYAEGIDVVAGADLALVPSFGDEPWFLPGKLYDYMLARTPVLAVATSPELERIVAQTGLGRCHRPDDAAAIERCIDDAIEARLRGRPFATPDEAAIAALSARGAARSLAVLFDDVAGQRAR